MGKNWRIMGAQGFGDLSMNPWVLAVLKRSPLLKGASAFSRLCLQIPGEYEEPVYYADKTYTGLVKYQSGEYKFEDVSFALNNLNNNEPSINKAAHDGQSVRIDNDIEFLISGKPLLRGNQTVPLYSVIERYSDIRHIFATPRYDYKRLSHFLDGLKLLKKTSFFSNNTSSENIMLTGLKRKTLELTMKR